MKYKFIFILLFSFFLSNSQTINLNESHIVDYFRTAQLIGDLDSNFSFTLKPFDIEKNDFKIDSSLFNSNEYAPTILSFMNGKGKLKILPVDYNIEYNSHHPYNRNNGSMIPNRGYQQLTSAGLYIEIGPLSIQLKPEHVFSENKSFQGFPESHYDIIWSKRYALWNTVDVPERFGIKAYSKTFLGQSNIKFNYKGLSFGVSNENLWWGPSIRN